jgi:hypothetical protein
LSLFFRGVTRLVTEKRGYNSRDVEETFYPAASEFILDFFARGYNRVLFRDIKIQHPQTFRAVALVVEDRASCFRRRSTCRNDNQIWVTAEEVAR